LSLEQAYSYNESRQCHLNERRIKFIIGRLKSYQLPLGSKILEIGSGTGWLLLRLSLIFPQYQFIGVEPNKDFILFAQQQTLPSNLKFLNGFAEQISKMEFENIDVILSNDVLHHVNATIESVIQNLSSKARLGKCKWLIIEPNCFNPYVFWCHWYLWRKDGEDIFYPWRFLKISRRYGWLLRRSSFLFLIPTRFKKYPIG